MRFWKKSEILFSFMLLTINHFKFRWNVTKMIFHQFLNSIFCWKNFFVRFINENISELFNEKSIVFCFEKNYASQYNFVLICFKFIIIFDFLFFHITKAENDADDTVFKKIFCTRFFFQKKDSAFCS